MWSCLQLERAAAKAGYELAILGVPKTVDNDLMGTDHAPGFGSAARFVATVTRDVGRDLYAVRNFESVRVLETMGRNVGWLSLSSGYLKREAQDPPHLIYLPEQAFSQETFLRDVEEMHHAYGYAVVVVSEGIPSHGRDNHLDSPNLGGVAGELGRPGVQRIRPSRTWGVAGHGTEKLLSVCLRTRPSGSRNTREQKRQDSASRGT